MKMNRFAVALGALLLLAPIAAQEVAPPPPTPHPLQKADIDTWLDGLVPYALDSGDLAGAVVTVVADGEILTSRGFGVADNKTGLAVDPDRTLFRVGSVSKLMTWTAIMQLVERGALDLDADVNAYVDFVIPEFEGQPVTLRQIMTHTAGFQEQLKFILAHDPAAQMSFEELVRGYVPPRIFASGTTPAYSNYATALAGYIVQRVSGQAFSNYVEQHIFTPLGMDSATFAQPVAASQLSDLAKGYAIASGEATPFELVSAEPAGSLSATGTDMGKFMLAHLQSGAPGQARILQPETIRAMHARQDTGIAGLNGMSLGFYENSINGHRVISHGGDTVVFHSDLNLFLEEGVGIFVSINSTGVNDAAYKLRSLLFSQFADRYFPTATTAPTAIAENNAPRLAGQYMSSRRSETSFVALTDLLSPTILAVDASGKLDTGNLPILGAAVQNWIEVEPFVWQASNSHERLAAVVENGRVTRLSLNSMAPVIVYEPVPWQRNATWIMPASLVSLGVLTLAAIQWPIAAIVRRRYGKRLDLVGLSRATYHGVRFSALLVVGVIAGWIAFISTVFADFTLLSSSTDAALLTLQIATIFSIIGLGVSATANGILAVQERRGLWSMLWALALLLAAFVVIWVAFMFNLLKIGVGY